MYFQEYMTRDSEVTTTQTPKHQLLSVSAKKMSGNKKKQNCETL